MGAEKVMVAMSGGVDSSVAAKLLVEQGYDCVGVTMQLFDKENPSQEQTCGSFNDIDDARNVANSLGMPYYVLNYEGTFKKCVIDHFCESYLKGETPNPCIDCNRYLKFGALQQKRAELGLDYVATGHYARRTYDKNIGRFLLKKGLDPKKDQSYVLYHLTQEQLAHMLFPLGELAKDQVRDKAQESNFVTAHKQESQDICFIPDGDYASFIERERGIKFKPGPIVNHEGKVVGTHTGLPCYTLGQRKGLGVAYSEPLYVLEKQMDTNTLVIGPKSALGVSKIFANDINLISVAELSSPKEVEVKANYRQSSKKALAWINKEGLLEVELLEPMQTCSPGQALVMYENDVVVGGGTICAYQ